MNRQFAPQRRSLRRKSDFPPLNTKTGKGPTEVECRRFLSAALFQKIERLWEKLRRLTSGERRFRIHSDRQKTARHQLLNGARRGAPFAARGRERRDARCFGESVCARAERYRRVRVEGGSAKRRHGAPSDTAASTYCCIHTGAAVARFLRKQSFPPARCLPFPCRATETRRRRPSPPAQRDIVAHAPAGEESFFREDARGVLAGETGGIGIAGAFPALRIVMTTVASCETLPFGSEAQ